MGTVMLTQLPLFSPLPTPDEMLRWDKLSIEAFCYPEAMLMENAGREALQVLHSHVALSPKVQVLILAGGGSNGGDGFTLARHLHNEGCQVLVYHTHPLKGTRGAVREHVRMAQRLGVNMLAVPASGELPLPLEWQYPDIVVDALCGIGMRGPLRSRELALVRNINARRKQSFIFAIDMPTGLCGLTGTPMPEAVRAHATVTFEAGKPGQFFLEATPYIGTLHVRRIGMPTQVRLQEPASWLLLAPEPGKWAAPAPDQHKGSAGKVLVLGGSTQYSGAPHLASLGALCAGAGVVHLACPATLAPWLRAAQPECIVHPMGKGDNWNDAVETVEALVQATAPGCIVMGPGMGRGPHARAVVEHLLGMPNRPPVVLDADALSFFYASNAEGTAVQAPELPLTLLGQEDCITPHPFELARLLPPAFHAAAKAMKNTENALPSPVNLADNVQANRPAALRAFIEMCQATLVVKGAGTLIAGQNTATVLSPFAVPTLATAGSGDVLGGIIGALRAKGIQPLESASLGVYLHARAGMLLAQQGPQGHLASHIAAMLPKVWQELCHA